MLTVVLMMARFWAGGTTTVAVRGARNACSGTNDQQFQPISRSMNAGSSAKPSGDQAASGGRGAQPITPSPLRQLTQAGAHTVPGTQSQPKRGSSTQRP